MIQNLKFSGFEKKHGLHLLPLQDDFNCTVFVQLKSALGLCETFFLKRVDVLSAISYNLVTADKSEVMKCRRIKVDGQLTIPRMNESLYG